MKLTDAKLRAAKPREKPYKLADGGGLYVEVFPSNSKLWRLKYRRVGGKETRLSLGPYPSVSLALARTKREELKSQRREGRDPALERRLERQHRASAAENSFEAVAREWLTKSGVKRTEAHNARILRRFERDVFPFIGGRPISELKASELLAALRKIEAREAIATAHRARGDCGAVFRFAVATGRAEHDISADLRGALTPENEKHFASITDPTEIGGLLRAIQSYKGTPEVRAALQLAPLLFVRPGELRNAEWAEFDFDQSQWVIPAEKTKMRTRHFVPLSVQAVAVLKDLMAINGRSRYVFPSARSQHRPMSEVAVLAALRRMGYTRDQMTGHGFRSMASTRLNEQGWNRDAIERQLGHAERDGVRAAYNYAEHLPERRKMMQAWADYLESLRDQRNVVAGAFGRAA